AIARSRRLRPSVVADGAVAAPPSSREDESGAEAPWQHGPGDDRWREATVPGCVHLDLLRHGLIDDPFRGTNELSLQWIEYAAWEYRCVFQSDRGWLNEEVVELCAD